MKPFNILVDDSKGCPQIIIDCIKVEKINQDIKGNNLPESLGEELISRLGKLKITSKNGNVIYTLGQDYSITK